MTLLFFQYLFLVIYLAALGLRGRVRGQGSKEGRKKKRG